MVGLLALAALAALALALHLQLSLFTPLPRRALRVLMYHQVTTGPAGRYSIPAEALRRQILWLRAHGYALVSLPQVLAAVENGGPLPDRGVLLTFDDGTTDALEVLHPLLRGLGARGALFAVPGWAGSVRELGGRRVPVLDAAGLRAAAASLDIGLHGHEHLDLRRLEPEEVEAELARAAKWLEQHGVPHLPALAYPFGAYPRKDPARRVAFLEAVRRAGVVAAFRIGNRVNPLPLSAPLEIHRTEIRGDEPFWVFRWKVRTGRLRAL
ncbi:MAG TPA: polysaccharide deacetylase family protein [Anaeromyxobacter sp.]|nr:polysaccharide deacetylase family protein [Anaeromyxobacter sp.]